MIPTAIERASTSRPTANAIPSIFNASGIVTPGAARSATTPTTTIARAAAVMPIAWFVPRIVEIGAEVDLVIELSYPISCCVS